MKYFCLVFIFLSGCATISEGAANIQIHNQMSSLLDKCEKVGPIVGVGSALWSPDWGFEYAKTDIREKAVGRGDSIVMLNSDHIGREVRIQGVLFNCYNRATASQAK